jgi:hypothetical protein
VRDSARDRIETTKNHRRPSIPPPSKDRGLLDGNLMNVCDICGKPQFHCGHGDVCENGHGGAPSHFEPDAPDLALQAKVWFRRNTEERRAAHNSLLGKKAVAEGCGYQPPQCPRCRDWKTVITRGEDGLLHEEECCRREKSVYAIGEAVVDTAEAVFKEAGCPADYCIQQNDGDTVIFGSTNRLKWSVLSGWTIFRSSCNEKFAVAARAYFGNGNLKEQ